jgi:hypothetical protein
VILYEAIDLTHLILSAKLAGVYQLISELRILKMNERDDSENEGPQFHDDRWIARRLGIYSSWS